MIYSDSVQFDSVVVLESLGPGEKRTGTWLYDKVLKPWADANPTFSVLYNAVGDKMDFFAALRAAEVQLLSQGHAPILHIEAHGDKDGILLSSGERILWEELRSIFTAINRKCDFNLFVVMALCRGWWLSRLLVPHQPSPVWGLLGPTEPVLDGDLKEAMRAFYVELLSSFDARKALDVANKHKTFKNWDYRLQTAEVMYCQVFHRYVAEMGTPEQLARRENELTYEIFRRHGCVLEIAFDARDRARALLTDHRKFFDFYRQNFFMLDIIPLNTGRFQLTYDDCNPTSVA